MAEKKLTIFTLGYSDNTSTNYLLDYLIKHGVTIDGAIFAKNKLKLNWKRFTSKIQMRGIVPTVKRIFENQLVRKREVSRLCHDHIHKVFYVDDINSNAVRDILTAHSVDLLILTSTPIIKPILININGLTILNVHTGWLPLYRGLDANLKALRDGNRPGVSIHRVVEKIDAGAIYLRETFEVDHNGNILEQLDENELVLGAKLLLEAIQLREQNMLQPIPLSEPLGKYEPLLTMKEKQRIIQNFKNARV